MSEDVKPRIWKAISIEWRKDSLVRMVTTFKEEGLPVIELEPTMRMMDELVKTLEQFEPESFVYDEGDENIRLGNEVLASLEKYKKFKEGLK